MRPASTRPRRAALAFWTSLAGYLVSPLLPAVAAEDGGLGPGGAAFAFNFTLVVGVILAFIFGFGLRDYIQRRLARAKASKKPAASPPRM